MPMITAAEAIIAAVDAHLTGTDLGTVEEEEAEDGGEELLRKKGVDRPDGRLNRRKDGEGDKVDEDNVQQLEPGFAQN
ncbi:hypothetical protein TYRP_017065 [Tyrophagus putrescentiae]|nr:hypothetical protein TYRP_017065 [Tyrophagus putrescentiae]